MCRRRQINRQQFYRYLSGDARPSPRKMQKFRDHFGVDESEILREHAQFREIVAIRRNSGAAQDPLGEFVVDINKVNPRSTRQLESLLGLCYNYLRPVEFPDMVLRSLLSVFTLGGLVYVKTIESYSAVKRRSRRMLKHTGIMYHTGEPIIVPERAAIIGQMMWTTILLLSRTDQSSVMSGLTLGVSSGIKRDLVCYRVIWESLGERIGVCAALSGAGLYDLGSPVIPRDIRAAISNDVRPDQAAFVVRDWVNETLCAPA